MGNMERAGCEQAATEGSVSNSLVELTSAPVEIGKAIEAAKMQAIEHFAAATVEEIMLAAAQKRLAILEARRKLVMATFNVTDVAKLGDKLAKNKYAAEKLHEIFGGTFELLKGDDGKPLSDVQIMDNDPDVGTYRIYTYFGRYTRTDGKVIEQMGSFSTKDAFFARAHDEWKTISDVNVVDVMTAAQTETYKKCIFRGTGLGDWTDEESTMLLSGAKGHDFKGSVAGAGKKEAVVAFAKAKGTRVVDLSDKDLEWYAKAYAENVADESKVKYRKGNQEILDAIHAEQKRRAGGGEPNQPDPEKPKKTDSPPDDSRGARLSKLHAALKDAFGAGNLKHVMPFLSGLMSRKIEAMSDLTDEEIPKVLAIGSEQLKAEAQDFIAAGHE
jgi:hypothetical protein